MKLIKKVLEISEQQKELCLFRLENTAGCYVELLNYGATVISIVVPDKFGTPKNVVLNYDDPVDYLTDPFYLGSTIGRFANRISNARFKLNGKVCYLDKNDGENSNHGGFWGFNKQVFDVEEKEDEIVFYLKSPDGAGGFPGNIDCRVVYSFNDSNELQITYQVRADKQTPFNPTNHAYFNLNPEHKTILDHRLKIESDDYLESDDAFLPTGKILPVTGTAFDFTEYRNIRERMPFKKEAINGFNTYFISREEESRGLKKLASLQEETSGRRLEVYSTMPGCMFYTGDYLSGKHVPFGGLCLEAQYYPDGMNKPGFEVNLLEPGQIKTDIIRYCFYSD